MRGAVAPVGQSHHNPVHRIPRKHYSACGLEDLPCRVMRHPLCGLTLPGLRTCYPIAESLQTAPELHSDLHEAATCRACRVLLPESLTCVILASLIRLRCQVILSVFRHLVILPVPPRQEGGVFEGPRRGVRRESYPMLWPQRSEIWVRHHASAAA